MNVFLSYRRADVPHMAGRLQLWLKQALNGSGSVFLDIENIPVGKRFEDVIAEQIRQSDVLLLVIGPRWLGDDGCRLADINDSVRMEVQTAQAKAVHVVPCLVDGTTMPAPDVFPAELRSIAGINAARISHDDFETDCGRLLAQLRQAAAARDSEKAKLIDAGRPSYSVVSLPDSIMEGRPQIAMREIPAGCFKMGGADGDGRADERPARLVTIARPFELAVTPVTVAQYRRFLEHDQRSPPFGWGDPRYGADDQPVIGVAWHDAVAFCEWLGLRLPTEAEWEYACRAGTTTRYSSGSHDDDLDDVGWHEGNSGGELHSVGLKRPNAFDLYDMHGNVFEWCQDWHGDYGSAPSDGTAQLAESARRVLRGGSWYVGAFKCRSAARASRHPTSRGAEAGFRPARTL